ncbi:AAA family ATPase [Bacillus sp. Bva_UNVM-123]|uniref:AAA family ATPase n=1 Tax=Bacillus sp. Bva_UNVM-123 TaxID=2829798 RepID=UPI00391F05B5
MENDQYFPSELLEMDIESKIKYFEDYTVAHPALKKAYQQLMKNILVAKPNSFLLVYGPSGVGKSTLFHKLINDYYQKYENEMETDKGFIPIAGVEAVSPEDGRFDWRDFYYRSLVSMKEPLIDYKISREFTENKLIAKSDTKAVLRRSLENAVKYRNTKLFLIDEAQHLTKVASSRSLRNQMEALKSFGAQMHIPVILFGTYDLLEFRDLGGQLIRRGLDVHFPRYRVEYQIEKEAFIDVLWNFQKHLPLEREPNLVDEWEFFYKRTIGCIGILKDWIFRTFKYHLHLDHNLKTLSMDSFSEFAHTIDQSYKMAEEAIDKEESLLPEQDEDNLDIKLNLSSEVEHEENNEDTNNDNKKRKPGVRNPKRDAVGLQEAQ